MFSTPVRSKSLIDNNINNDGGDENMFAYQFLYNNNNSERDGNINDNNDVESLMRSFNTPPLKRFTNNSNLGPTTPSTLADSPLIQSPCSNESDCEPQIAKSFSVKRIFHSNSIGIKNETFSLWIWQLNITISKFPLGSDWTIEMACLKQSASLFEVFECCYINLLW